MLALALHTSSPDLGLALIDASGAIRHQVWPLGRDLATHLHTCLIDILAGRAWHELDFLAVATGPGGFTGTRMGVVTARTLAQQLDIPLFGISSLAAIAEHQRQTGPIPRHLAVQLPAQRGELFGAIYELTATDLIPHLPDQVFTQTTWSHTLATWTHPYQGIEASGSLADTVSAVLTLAQRGWQAGARPTWAEVLPFYGQHPVET